MSGYSGTAGRAGMQSLAAILTEGRIGSRPAASRAFNIVCHCYIKIQSEAVDVNMGTMKLSINLFSTPCPPVLGDIPSPWHPPMADPLHSPCVIQSVPL